MLVSSFSTRNSVALAQLRSTDENVCLSFAKNKSEESMRIGLVAKVIPEKKIGFIRAEDLREDVFFHFSRVEQIGRLDLQEGEEVEFEIDELDRIEKRQLRATLVRRSVRPLTMRLQTSDAPELNAHHHPKARKRRPTWREKKEPEEATDETNPGASDE